MWQQVCIRLKPYRRGFHLITAEVERQLPQLTHIRVGLCHLFLQHTSASLTLNENADPSVRGDMEEHFNRFVPEGVSYYRHTCEGPDDMPAHIKSSVLGCSVLLPVGNGRLALGTWQGIYLGEHRDSAGGRRILATLQGAECLV